jgi:chromate reductase
MKYIISGTNRPGSRSLQICHIVQKIYRALGEEIELIDLKTLDIHTANGDYGDSASPEMKSAIVKINRAEGLVIVCPEYNGSYPGVLKYFIDHWKYPESFEFRPVAFIGLGGKFGGLRPVEHLQGVFGYRNAFIYPERVFLFDIWNHLKEGEIADQQTMALLKSQAVGFQKFTKALESVGLDANSRPKTKP